MVTVHRAFGFRFMIFSNDHEPAHVHVFGQGGEAKLNLTGSHGVVLESAAGISRIDARRIVAEMQANKELLLAAWREIHG